MTKVIVIGGGPGGRICSMALAKLGAEVTLIEKKHLAGTCLNEGCMVTCAFNDVVKTLNEVKHLEDIGVLESQEVKFNYKDITKKIKETQEILRKINHNDTVESGVEVVYGEARIEKGKHIFVGDDEYKYDKLVIATGSNPHIPDIKSVKNGITHRDILDLEELPEKLVVIGGGVIGCEIANIFSALGSEVHLVSRGSLFKYLDDAIVEYIETKLMKNIHIHKNTVAEEISKDGVKTNNGFIEGLAFIATGREPNSEMFTGLVRVDDNGAIIVDEHMQTNNHKIYAVGDVIGGTLLTPVARMEGTVAARNIMGIEVSADYNNIPRSISLNQDVSLINTGNEDSESNVLKLNTPGLAGPGAFWHVLSGDTGITKIKIQPETGEFYRVASVAPNSRLNMAYLGMLMRMGANYEDFEKFIEVHPSTDAVSTLVKYVL